MARGWVADCCNNNPSERPGGRLGCRLLTFCDLTITFRNALACGWVDDCLCPFLGCGSYKSPFVGTLSLLADGLIASNAAALVPPARRLLSCLTEILNVAGRRPATRAALNLHIRVCNNLRYGARDASAFLTLPCSILVLRKLRPKLNLQIIKRKKIKSATEAIEGVSKKTKK